MPCNILGKNQRIFHIFLFFLLMIHFRFERISLLSSSLFLCDSSFWSLIIICNSLAFVIIVIVFFALNFRLLVFFYLLFLKHFCCEKNQAVLYIPFNISVGVLWSLNFSHSFILNRTPHIFVILPIFVRYLLSPGSSNQNSKILYRVESMFSVVVVAHSAPVFISYYFFSLSLFLFLLWFATVALCSFSNASLYGAFSLFPSFVHSHSLFSLSGVFFRSLLLGVFSKCHTDKSWRGKRKREREWERKRKKKTKMSVVVELWSIVSVGLWLCFVMFCLISYSFFCRVCYVEYIVESICL